MTTPTKLCSKNVCIICSSVNKLLLNILNSRCNNLPLKVVLLSILILISCKSMKKCRRVLLPIIPESTDNINKAVEKLDGFEELFGCGGLSVNNFVDHSYAITSSKPNLSNENMNKYNKGMYGDGIRNFVSQVDYIENDGEEKLLFLTENKTKLVIDAVKSRSIKLLCEIIFNIEKLYPY